MLFIIKFLILIKIVSLNKNLKNKKNLTNIINKIQNYEVFSNLLTPIKKKKKK